MPVFCHSCGAALADRAAFCSACGTRAATPECNIVGESINPTQVESAVVHTEHPPNPKNSFFYGIGRVIGKHALISAFLIIVVCLLVSYDFKKLEALFEGISSTETATSTVQQGESEQRGPYIPQLQKSFTSMIESFIPGYKAADTEIRKTNVRFERKDAILRYFSGSGSLRFQGWLGEMQELRTESDGKASFSVKLKGSDTVITTWNNSLSDSLSNTMISRSDALYPSLMDIKNGDDVTVSGTFVMEYGGQDYVREASLTEEGSMTSPEFIVRFSQIIKGSVPTTSAAVLKERPALNPSERVVRPVQIPEMSRPAPVANDGSVSSPAVKTSTLTGVYRGKVHNTKAQLWAAFETTIQEQPGKLLSGCMLVHRPLYGSGKLSGDGRTSRITFDVPSSVGVIHFTGNREGDEISGAYYVVQAGAVQSFGEFELNRQGELPTDFDTHDCPDDSVQ